MTLLFARWTADAKAFFTFAGVGLVLLGVAGWWFATRAVRSYREGQRNRTLLFGVALSLCAVAFLGLLVIAIVLLPFALYWES